MIRLFCTILLTITIGICAQQENSDSARILTDSTADPASVDSSGGKAISDSDTLFDSSTVHDTSAATDDSGGVSDSSDLPTDSLSADSTIADSSENDSLSIDSLAADSLVTDSLATDSLWDESKASDSVSAPLYTEIDSAENNDSASGAAVNESKRFDAARSWLKAVGGLLKNHPLVLLISRYRRQLVNLLISLVVIFATVLFLYRRREKKRFLTTTRLSVMDKEVQRACRYLESNYADPDLTVEKICEELVTGAAFLQTLFERELGMKVEEFLTHVRINRATILAKEEPAMDVNSLAEACGFTDSRQFQDSFAKVNGVTIEQLRQSNQYA